MLRRAKSTVSRCDFANFRLHSTVICRLPPTSVTSRSICFSENTLQIAPGVREVDTFHSKGSKKRVRNYTRQDGSRKTSMPDDAPNNTHTSLRTFLSSPNHPTAKYTTSELVELYAAEKSQETLRAVGSPNLTALASTFGELTFPRRTHPSIYTSHLTPWVTKDDSIDCCQFILDIMRDKEGLGWRLSNIDRYWAMRAYLEMSNRGSPQCLHSAKAQYLHIYKQTFSPEVHVVLLEGLMSSNSSEHLDFVSITVCTIITTFRKLHPRYLNLLWALMSHTSSADSREALLSAVRLRCITLLRTPQTSQTSLESIPSNTFQLAYVLRDVFCGIEESTLPLFVRRWAVSLLSTLFHNKLSLEVRWMYLALFQSAQIPSAWDGYESMEGLRTRGLTVDLELLSWMNALQREEEIVKQDGFREYIRRLWMTWSRDQQRQTPRFVGQIILASFFNFAGRTRDGHLIEACQLYCVQTKLLSDVTYRTRGQIKCVVVAYIASQIRWKGISADIFTYIRSMARDDRWNGEVLQEVIRSLLPGDDFPTARELYDLCISSGIELGGIIEEFSTQLLTCGWQTLLPYLHDHTEFSIMQTRRILERVMESLREDKVQLLYPPGSAILSIALVNMLVDTECGIGHLKWAFRYNIVLLVSSGESKRAFSVLSFVFSRQSAFFSPRYLEKLLRLLVRRREFPIATQLMNLVNTDMFKEWSINVLVQAGARKVAFRTYKNIASRLSSMSLVALQRQFKFHFHEPPRMLTNLRYINSILEENMPVSHIVYILRLLLSSSRPEAFTTLFTRLLERLPPKLKTHLGNIFLSRLLPGFSPRNAQLVKKLIVTKRFLEARVGFEEDRVTINIMLASFLRWKTVFTAQHIRRLFDHLVRSGYPADPMFCTALGAPFGTSLSRSPPFRLSEKLSSNISYSRHVKPLYKMFIKAFYDRGDRGAGKLIRNILMIEERRERERVRARAIQMAQYRSVNQVADST